MNRTALVASLLALALPALVLTRPASAQAPALPEARLLEVDAPIVSATLYIDRAMVTREAALPQDQGTFELRVQGLPAAIDDESLSARIEGGRLLDVRLELRTLPNDPTTNPELKAAIAQLEDARRLSEAQALQAGLLNDQNGLLNAIAQKTATESAKDFGSKSLDPAALAAQVEFLASARGRLIEQRLKLERETRDNNELVAALADKVKRLGGTQRIERTAVVTVGKSARGDGTMRLSYLVGRAGWGPNYVVRAVDTGDDATDALAVEYSATIEQSTGEDWNGVTLTLSTAQPTRRPAPRGLAPEFLSVFVPPPPVVMGGLVSDGAMFDKAGAPRTGSGGGGGGFGAPGSPGGIIGDAGEDPMALGIELEKSFADAEALGGSVVTYTIPRKVTVPSDANRTSTQRVATIDLKPAFSHVARPLVDELVYLRARVRNDSAYTFLEGPAKIFVGDDSVGEVMFPEVAPGAEMTFWFGGDPRLSAMRTLVSREKREEGVFGKSGVETSKWRIDLVSSAAGATTVEVDDLVPVSRNEKIKVELRDLSLPLSTAEAYLKGPRTQGLLRWMVPMTGRGADGKPAERSISWTVRTTVPSDVTVVSERGDEIEG